MVLYKRPEGGFTFKDVLLQGIKSITLILEPQSFWHDKPADQQSSFLVSKQTFKESSSHIVDLRTVTFQQHHAGSIWRKEVFNKVSDLQDVHYLKNIDRNHQLTYSCNWEWFKCLEGSDYKITFKLIYRHLLLTLLLHLHDWKLISNIFICFKQ